MNDITRCAICDVPCHASESDDYDRCPACAPTAPLRVGGTAIYTGSAVGPGGNIRRGDRVRVVRIIGSAARIIPAGSPATSKFAMRVAFVRDGAGVDAAFLIPVQGDQDAR